VFGGLLKLGNYGEKVVGGNCFVVSFVSLVMTYLEFEDHVKRAKKRLERVQATARRIKVPPQSELDKISLSSPSSRQSKKNLDCQF